MSFTFDDGPDPTWTPRVLSELECLGARATFFVVGAQALLHPEIVSAIAQAGHDVQLHCHHHVRHSQMSEPELRRDTEAALEALARVEVTPTLWRAPWGIATPASTHVARSLGLRLVRWSIDTHDWRGDAPLDMLAAAEPRLARGGSVLMHDALGPGSQRTGCENTLALLERLAAATSERGLRLEPFCLAEAEPAAR